MSCRTRLCRRPGFSLVELLTVVSIIALLISILLPSIAAIQKRVKSAATQNMIQVISTGIETFKADPGVGGAYPDSQARDTASPYVLNQTIKPTGAALLVWALAGADYIGTPGFKDLNGNNTWRDDTGPNGLYKITGNVADISRSGPFVAIERMRRPRQSAPGRFDLEKYPLPSGEYLTSPCFLDPFERPLLYYRANPAGLRVAQRAYADTTDANSSGMYYHEDNMAITGYINRSINQPPPASPDVRGLDLGRGLNHPLAFFNSGIAGSGLASDKNPLIVSQTGLGRLIYDSGVVPPLYRAQRPDSYILISAGPDGLYGNGDDVANFSVNK